MSFNISYKFEAIDKFTNVSQRIGRSITKLAQRFAKMREKIKHAGESLMRVGRQLAVGVTLPIVAAGSAAVIAAARMEKITTQFHSILGSGKKAHKFVQKLTSFTARTPFRIRGVSAAAQELFHLEFKTKQVIPTLRMLGDVAAGAGTTMAESKADLLTLAAIYGRIHIQGRAYYRDVRQLIMMKTPVAKVLKKMAEEAGHYNINLTKLASKGAITSAVMVEVFRRMTSKGGMFYRQMELQSHTLMGAFSTLQDNVELTLIPLGKLISDVLHLKQIQEKFIAFLEKLRPKIKIFEKTHKTLSKIIIAVALMAAALGPILMMIGLFVFTISAALSPITLVAAAIFSLVGYFTYLYATSKQFRTQVQDIYATIKSLMPIIKPVLAMFKLMLNYLEEINKISTSALVVAFKVIGNILQTLIVIPIKDIISSIKWIHSFFGKKTSPINVVHKNKLGATSPLLPWSNLGATSPLNLAPQKVQSEMHISVYDPTKVVKNIYGKSDGKMDFDLGTNMALSNI